MQDESVVFAFLWVVKQIFTVVRIEFFDEVFSNVPFIEELFRNEMLLLEEPYEDETGDETDAALVVEFVIVCIRCKVVGETYNLYSPSIPIAEFGIELLGEQVAGEHLHPVLVKLFVVWIGLVTNRCQNVNVSTMRIQAVDAA